MPYKYLIFSDAVACDNGYNFFANLPAQTREHPFLFNHGGCDCSVADADVIIIEDADIVDNQISYANSYAIVAELLSYGMPLRTVYHSRERQIKKHEFDEVFTRLSMVPFIQQSHIKGSVYDVELRAMQMAMTANDLSTYQTAMKALDDRVFIEPELMQLDADLFTAFYDENQTLFQKLLNKKNQYLEQLLNR